MEVGLSKGELTQLEALAVDMARRAGAMLLERFEQAVKVEFKAQGQRDPVTAVDRESEELLRRAIKEAYPQHAVVGEEGAIEPGTGAGEMIWVLDPLDGTANFVGGLPLFAVSIAVLHRFRPMACALFTSYSHRRRPGVFHAHLGGGAFCEEESLSCAPTLEQMPVKLSGTLWRDMVRAWPKLAKKGVRLEMRSLGSVVLEMALVAAGVMQGAAFRSPRVWDVAAGTLLVQEASGTVLTRSSRNSQWRPLEVFAVKEQLLGQPAEGLRQWSAPVLIGQQELVELLAAARKRPRFWLLPLPLPFR